MRSTSLLTLAVSMLAVEDAIDAMEWGLGLGGLAAMQARADANFKVLADWVERTPWVEFLAAEPAERSNTSVCFVIADPAITALDADAQAAFAKAIVNRLDKEGVAYDIGGYRDAPTGLRIWAGCTVETSDLEALTPWLDWAFATEKAALQAAASAALTRRCLVATTCPVLKRKNSASIVPAITSIKATTHQICADGPPGSTGRVMFIPQTPTTTLRGMKMVDMIVSTFMTWLRRFDWLERKASTSPVARSCSRMASSLNRTSWSNTSRNL